MRTVNLVSRASVFACVLALCAACGSSNPSTSAGTSAGSTTGPAGTTTAGTTSGGASTGGTTTGAATTGGSTTGAHNPIILAQRIQGPDGRLYYVSVLDQMPTAAIDLSTAREFSSADVELYNGEVYIRDRKANTMTRFSVDASNNLVQDGQFSFEAAGLPSGRFYDVFVSPTLAYVMDGVDLEMIGWDPTNMTLLPASVIDISFLADASTLPDITLGIPTQTADQILVPVSWEDEDNLVTSPSMGAALVLPTNASAAPAVITHPGVAGAYVAWGFDGNGYVGGAIGGDIQLFGSVYPDAGPIPSSGIARINAGTGTFDPDYTVDINKITGSTGVWAVHMLDSNDVLTQILDPSVDTSTFATPDDVYASTDYYFAMINLDAGTVVRQTSVPAGGIANSQEHVVDGVLYVQVIGASGSDVYPVTAAGVGAKQFDIPGGDLWFAQRLH